MKGVKTLGWWVMWDKDPDMQCNGIEIPWYEVGWRYVMQWGWDLMICRVVGWRSRYVTGRRTLRWDVLWDKDPKYVVGQNTLRWDVMWDKDPDMLRVKEPWDEICSGIKIPWMLWVEEPYDETCSGIKIPDMLRVKEPWAWLDGRGSPSTMQRWLWVRCSIQGAWVGCILMMQYLHMAWKDANLRPQKWCIFVQCMGYDACLNVMWSNMLTVCEDECFDDKNVWYTPYDVIQYANSMQWCMCFDDMNAWYTPCDVIQYANSMQGCMRFDECLIHTMWCDTIC